MKQIDLTKIEGKILEYIKEHILITGIPPTLREIQKKFSYKAIGTVQDHIASLIRKGAVLREKGKARSIQPAETVTSHKRIKRIPILGQIAAGFPVLSEENIMGYVPMFSEGAYGKEIFALIVKGTSMVEAGIFDGDTAIIEKGPIAENGDIVAVSINDEVTLKEFKKDPTGAVNLIPRNSDMLPMVYSKNQNVDMKIIGKMVGLYRKYR
ncbi:MAG: repressor LexA [Candidatus Aureabacteria bacterium]|nr:repressor LexA [Candidatus Auribacterota bacterium]